MKFLDRPIRSTNLRRIRTHIEWKVETHIRSPEPGPSNPSIRSRISRAALFVNVMAKILDGYTCFSTTKYAIRCVNTRVFPEPAPAIMSKGPSVVLTARACSGFMPFSKSSDSLFILVPPFRNICSYYILLTQVKEQISQHRLFL